MTDTDQDSPSHDDVRRSAENNPRPAPDKAEGKAASDERAKDDAKETAAEETRKKRRPLVVTIGIVVVGLLVVAGLYYWLTTRNLESTDDAYTDGRAINIASQVNGTVLSLDVNDNQFVKKDQLLIHIDPRQYINDRDQAEGGAGDREGAIRGPAARRRNRAQEFSGPARAGAGPARHRAGQSGQGAGRFDRQKSLPSLRPRSRTSMRPPPR